MKKYLILFIILLLGVNIGYAHIVYLKDGREIKAGKVWEDKLGFIIDDVALYGFKKEGMPRNLVDKLRPLENRAFREKERLFTTVQRSIGEANLQKYRSLIEKYLVEKTVVSYEKDGNIVSVNKPEVLRIEYTYDEFEPVVGVSSLDIEAQGAIAKEKEELYERFRRAKDYKTDYGSASKGRAYYTKQQRELQKLIKEIERDPVGYFMRREPWKVNLPMMLTPEQCAKMCGVSLSAVSKTTIKDTSYSSYKSKQCMTYCTRKYRENEWRKQKAKDKVRKTKK